jgi:hypothetical protein
MGYWGTLIAACTNGQVPGLLRDLGAEISEHQHARRGDGWQVFSVPDNLVADDGVLSHLALESGTPLLAAYFADSDYGWLVGVSPTKETWQAWLDPKTAFVFERDHQVMQGMPKSEANRRARQMIRKFGLGPTEAAECAVQWAAEAGYTVSARPIRQILSCRRPPGLGAVVRLPWLRYAFAEDSFFALLDNLGVPRISPS